MVLNYKDIAMGTNSNEEITNSLENDIFSERVSLDQNTRKSKFNQEILQYPLNVVMMVVGHRLDITYNLKY